MFLLGYFGLMGIINYQIYTQQKCIVQDHSVLIAGDSQTRRGLNPELFYNAINISLPAEPYVSTYWKLKKVFQSTIPDTIILGFGPHNLSGYNDFKFSDDKWASTMFERNYAIQEFRNLKSIKVDYFKFIKVLWKQTCFYPKLDHCTYIGHYLNSNTTNFTNTEVVVKRHYYRNGKEVGVSNTSISYLESIVNLCHENGTTLILVHHPVHERYSKKIPEQNMAKYEEVKNKMISDGITVIEESGRLYDDSMYINANHLNEKGATKFTKRLIGLLNSNR